MSISTYAQFQAQSSSQKVGLVRLEAAKRLIGFSLYSGAVYSVSGFDFEDLLAVSVEGTALTSVGSVGAIVAGSYYHDRTNQTLYVQASDSSNPNGLFLWIRFSLFFSSSGVIAPKDLGSGADVFWRPLLESTSDFGVELDNQNQIGVAIEGSGSIVLKMDRSFWAPIYDKYYFENQRCFIYSWSPTLPITEAKLIYRGRIQGKSWDRDSLKFSLKDFLNELRAPIELARIGDYPGARVPEKLEKAFQRRIYGYVYGHRPTNIDQELDGYPLTGTFSISTTGTDLTGSGTAFLSELSPGDEILLNGDEEAVSVVSISSDTAATVSDAYTGNPKSGVTALIRPSHPKRYMNRTHLIAGHELTEFEATITAAEAFNYFDVDSSDGFRAGDAITVGSEVSEIDRVVGNRIFLSLFLTAVPTVGATVTRDCVSNVRIGKRLLQKTRDYTYDAETAEITLTPLAEFYVAPATLVGGSISFTNTSRSITGTALKAQLKPGDWVRANGQATYFEILSVDSDTAATLRTAATYTTSTTAYMKRPEVYAEGESVLSCDVVGLSDTGQSTGTLLYSAPEIVQDILERAGLTDFLNAQTFTDAAELSRERLGLVIPDVYEADSAPKVRDVINSINKSVFGSLVQNEDFELEYSVLHPSRSDSLTRLDESDILKLTIESNSDRIVGTSVVEYRRKEFDYLSDDESFLIASKLSKAGTYLAGSDKEFRTKTLLVDDTAAQIMANRWALIFEVSSSVVSVSTKMQLARAQIGERVEISHPELYERAGTAIKKKIAAVSAAKRSIHSSSVKLDDLANTFSRCGVVTDSAASDYASATDAEKLLNGYITDDYGMIDDDPETVGVHLIF